MATKKPLMGQGCVAVVDPGEGSGGAAPPYFWTKLRPKGPKKYWGGDQAFPPYFKVWIWHCVALVEEDKTEAGRVLGGLPPLFLDQTEAQRAKKKLGGGRLDPPPLFQGLDLALCCFGGGRQSGRTFNAFSD